VKRGGIGGNVAKKQRLGGGSYDDAETQAQGCLHKVTVCGWVAVQAVTSQVARCVRRW
jgi:hypothetical protein